MQNSASHSSIQKKKVLIVVFDLINFGSFSRESDSADIFSALDHFYISSKAKIEKNGGKVVKFISDSGLAYFEADDADKGIRTMWELKKDTDIWFSKITAKGGLAVNCHVGEVTMGEITGPHGRQLEILGDAVNTTFTLGKRQFLLSPEAFRSLESETRKIFKKYTPPIVYRLSQEIG
jgi:class 3 adenylate cyclase